jgi:outer membrane protein assembly factor BamB
MRDATSPEIAQELTRKVLAPLLEVSGEELEDLRRFLLVLESQTGLVPLAPGEADLGQGGHLLPFPLPGGGALQGFRERLERLRTPPGGLPEERLFFPPEDRRGGTLPPWALSERALGNWHELRPDISRALGNLQPLLARIHLCWFASPDWWMYHHDEVHSGTASGCSAISSLNVHKLALQQPVTPVDGNVVSVPTIVDGKIYVGTGTAPGGGTLYKIDLATGVVDGSFPTTGVAKYPGYAGVGGSPAVVGNRVYFTALHGKVYCLDATTMTPAAPHPPALWTTDLKNPSQAQNQPITNPSGDTWSGPLVVNGKVYVGSGEGEYGAFGFVWCLEASTGRVSWVFCTNRFSSAADNAPNVLPASAAPGGLPAWASNAGFSVLADPPHRGASVWSSCAYDAATNRIFVGTGNSRDGLPDADYGSGLLALDADTGVFQGFFQPSQGDSYYPGDADVDCPGSPTVFRRGGTRVVGIGSKNGSYFLLDTGTMAVLARRQLLPKDAVTGAQLPNVAPGGATGRENRSGVFGTAAVDHALGRLFIGLGGYADFDPDTTPFLRAVDWSTLADAWATSVDVVGANHVTRYVVPRPPMYGPGSAAGLSSPAVVNDVVFVSTSAPALYALSAATGLCLWPAPGLTGWGYVLGPAVYEDWVVVGCGPAVYRYRLPWLWWWPPWLWWRRFIPPIYYAYDPWWRLRPPPPPPPPEPVPEIELG